MFNQIRSKSYLLSYNIISVRMSAIRTPCVLFILTTHRGFSFLTCAHASCTSMRIIFNFWEIGSVSLRYRVRVRSLARWVVACVACVEPVRALITTLNISQCQWLIQGSTNRIPLYTYSLYINNVNHLWLCSAVEDPAGITFDQRPKCCYVPMYI